MSRTPEPMIPTQSTLTVRVTRAWITLLAFGITGEHVAAQVFPHTQQSAPLHDPVRPLRPCQPVITTASDLPRATECVDYAFALTATGGGGGPYSFGVTSGVLPAGLALAANGVLSGLPTPASATIFTVTVTSASGCSNSADFVLPVSLGHRASDAQAAQRIPPVLTGGSGIVADDTTSSTITVTNISPFVAVTGIDVRVTLVHQRVGDLSLTLVCPDGARVALATQLGGSGTSYLGTHFSDGASTPVCVATAPFSDSYRPVQSIGVHAANGTWTLEISDGAAGKIGRLLDWSLDFETALYETPTPFAATMWRVTPASAPSALQAVVVDDTRVYFSAGSDLRGIVKSDTTSASNWTRTFSGLLPNRLLPLARSFSLDPVLIANGSDGFVYALNPTNGSTVWSRSTRRPSCATDTLAAGSVAQIWDRSSCDFQTVISSDLVIAGTDFQCGTTTLNRVIAINATTGAIRWSHNSTGTYAVDRVMGLAVDHDRDRVYAVTDETVPLASQPTVFALDTLTGARDWSRDLDAIAVAPVVARDGVYVVTRDAVVHKLDPQSGTTIWSLSVAATAVQVLVPMAYDATRGLLFVSGTSGYGIAIHDDGASASIAWSSNLSGHLCTSVAVAPFLGNAYFGSSSGRAYQLDISTGANARFATVITPGLPAPTTQLFVDASTGGGLAEARLMTMAGRAIGRHRTHWIGAGDHVARGSLDPAVLPQIDTTIAGNTTPPSPAVGQNVIDSLTVTAWPNRTPDCVVVEATIPAGMSFVSASVSQGSVSVQGTQITARLGQIPNLGTGSVQVTLRLDVAGSFPRTYVVSAEGSDPTPLNNSITLTN